ncbi:thymidine phosphorylase [Roseovarius sp. A21]|uniref:Thymidine phosphorylase n=1 Tax=Roseovarius bejariae TaxID=2576383 RepID=A0A844CYU0_9RHOB|nr:thymidine phosphorylase [Roseovarius bejariae]MRU16266.1 thymidine phosphorylase [Roseovarius bejariae]
MDARQIIAKARDGQPLGHDALNWMAQGLADHRVSDAQAAAFAMAVLLKGLSAEDRTALTLAMRDSGKVLSWPTDRPVIDKHSTGGLGDCVSLVLAPALAACGAIVPMVSGRGLGHTGGTLDKLEAIPGLTTTLTEGQFRRAIDHAGCAIVSATADIAPADRRLYAIRDVTATVESLDLITASILSKKLAAGLEGLVLDVKLGSGAFMKTPEDATALAAALVDTANAAGCKTSALITDMNQPLAPALGNALEVSEVMKVLTGQAKGRLHDLNCALGGVALSNADLAADPNTGAAQIADAIGNGHAAEHFGHMVAAMGGPVHFTDQWQRFLPEATVIMEVEAPRAGYIAAMEGEAMGLAAIILGAGRQVETDLVDPAVGIDQVLPLGAKIAKGQPLCRIHAARTDQADRAAEMLLNAITISDSAPEVPPLIHDRLG